MEHLGTAHLAAERGGDALVAQADAEQRQAAGEMAQRGDRDAGLGGRARPGETITDCGASASISSTVIWSLRLTSTCAPSVQRYWTTL